MFQKSNFVVVISSRKGYFATDVLHPVKFVKTIATSLADIRKNTLNILFWKNYFYCKCCNQFKQAKILLYLLFMISNFTSNFTIYNLQYRRVFWIIWNFFKFWLLTRQFLWIMAWNCRIILEDTGLSKFSC